MDAPVAWTDVGDEAGVAVSRSEPLQAAANDETFALLVERQARFMFRVAYGLLRSVADAEDAVQEALLKLYRSGAWAGIQDERAFLARAVWRVALDRLPRRNEMDAAELDLVARGESPEETAVGAGERVLLRRLIEGLPEELRQPLVLSAVEEMTSREVAAAIGIPEGTVRTRVMRAKAELRRRFEALRGVRR